MLIFNRMLIGKPIGGQIPEHVFREYYGPDFNLIPFLKKCCDNRNTPRYLENVRQKIFEQLRYIGGAPSIQMSEIPPSFSLKSDDDPDRSDKP